ncbi:MAG TPA: XRE family transcriptional regulator [Lachnospiraceae bacterium]|nr:XRE family transcriptional regulator [Lachnospiraceae bacterium]
MKYVHIKINEMLKANGISKTKICKDLDLPRGNFNKYCRDEFQRIDARLLIKLCDYFQCDLSELLEICEKDV